MIEQIIREIESQGWCYRTNVIGPTELASINHYFDEHRQDFRPAKVGSQDNRQRVEAIRGDYTCWLDPMDPPQAFKSQIEFLAEIKNALNARFFLGLQDFECHLAYYPPGTFYKKHSDRFGKDSSRSLSFIFYLHQYWDEKDGGELVMYHNDGSPLKTISPMPGSFICFLSEDFPHEVKTGLKERRSLTGWMHRKILY